MPEKRNHLPVSWLIPNMVTALALCCGLTAIKFAISEKWENAFLFIFAAIILDGMDGRLARMLKASSTFGAQLDSLSDFLSFGVAPPLVLYLWTLSDFKGFGWGVVLIYTVCCALRLARFNTALFDRKDVNSDKFFTGVPAPVGAALALLPMALSFQFEKEMLSDNFIVTGNLLLVGLLMASRIPTLSIKKIKIRVDMAIPAMIAAALMIIMIIIEPWATVITLTAIYYLSIPYTIYQASRTRGLEN